MNDGFQRIVGDGDKIKAALKSIVRCFDKKKRMRLSFGKSS
jgi:hypothetical protein